MRAPSTPPASTRGCCRRRRASRARCRGFATRGARRSGSSNGYDKLKTSVENERAVISPRVDTLMVGGASILLIGLVFALGAFPINAYVKPLLVALTLFINWPHF